MTHDSTPVDAGRDFPGRRPPRAAHRRAGRAALVLLAVLAVLLGADAALLATRVGRYDVDLPDEAGDTWVLVGLDSRAHIPDGAPTGDFGTAADVPGSRADVVVVVHRTDAGVRALSVPRDVVVRTDRGATRLTLSWLHGPRGLRDALCTLGIPTDHLVTVDLAGFADLVDAAGGLDVPIPQPVRDARAGLLITRSGRRHVDGLTALALVRSRHPEHLVDGQWVAAPADPDGRASTAGAVVAALGEAVHRAVARPWRLQRMAWAASGAVTVDRSTSFADLVSLARTRIDAVPVLPVADPVGTATSRLATDETVAAVAAAGMSCRG